MSTVIVKPGGVIEKDPNEKKTIPFDWDTDGNLAEGAIISISTWTITAERPTGESPVNLDSDNESILAGSRKTQARLTGGTLGTRYRVTNHITTNESPNQEKEKSVFVEIVDL